MAWRAPPGGFVKINFDGTKSPQGAAGGFILRNWEGQFIKAGSFPLGSASVLVAEATAMRNGVRAAVAAGFTRIHIEGDNQVLVQAVKGLIHPPWEIQVLVQDIHLLLHQCTSVIISHIFREGNRAADWLARFALSRCTSVSWDKLPPRELHCILNEDYLGRTLARRAA